MVQAILVWSGAVVALVMILLMAIGPVIVEIDSWWYERQHERRRRARKAAEQAQPVAVGSGTVRS
jgi:hypothetical protein